LSKRCERAKPQYEQQSTTKGEAMRRIIGTLMVTALGTVALSTGGCERRPQEADHAATAAAPTKAASLPMGLFAPAAPAGARTVSEVKADASASGNVIVHGRIGGRREPFVSGAAMFLLADRSLRPCNELHGDSCPTPWDYCCEAREAMAAGTATVQVVGGDGKPLAVSVKGIQGLEPLAKVTVAGEIMPRSDTGALVINAKQIFVHPSGG
jgi:hypothetical protein